MNCTKHTEKKEERKCRWTNQAGSAKNMAAMLQIPTVTGFAINAQSKDIISAINAEAMQEDLAKQCMKLQGVKNATDLCVASV